MGASGRGRVEERRALLVWRSPRPRLASFSEALVDHTDVRNQFDGTINSTIAINYSQYSALLNAQQQVCHVSIHSAFGVVSHVPRSPPRWSRRHAPRRLPRQAPPLAGTAAARHRARAPRMLPVWPLGHSRALRTGNQEGGDVGGGAVSDRRAPTPPRRARAPRGPPGRESDKRVRSPGRTPLEGGASRVRRGCVGGGPPSPPRPPALSHWERGLGCIRGECRGGLRLSVWRMG